MAPSPGQIEQVLDGRRILVAVTGAIAAYKTCTVVSRLVQAGAEVTVCMTEAATRFVGPLTFQSLTGRTVFISLWQADQRPDAQHIALARSADLMLIAPATANIIAKIAHGIADDLVSTVACALPAQTPALLAPAMNADMWANPITQDNLDRLRRLRHWQVVGPETGWQACRTEGHGRMSQPQEIFQAVVELLSRPSRT